MVTNISLLLSKGDLETFRSEILKLSHPELLMYNARREGIYICLVKARYIVKYLFSFNIQVFIWMFLMCGIIYTYFLKGHESNIRHTIQKHKLSKYSKNINCYFCLKIFYCWSRQTIKYQVNKISTARYPFQFKSKLN